MGTFDDAGNSKEQAVEFIDKSTEFFDRYEESNENSAEINADWTDFKDEEIEDPTMPSREFQRAEQFIKQGPEFSCNHTFCQECVWNIHSASVLQNIKQSYDILLGHYNGAVTTYNKLHRDHTKVLNVRQEDQQKCEEMKAKADKSSKEMRDLVQAYTTLERELIVEKEKGVHVADLSRALHDRCKNAEERERRLDKQLLYLQDRCKEAETRAKRKEQQADKADALEKILAEMDKLLAAEKEKATRVSDLSRSLQERYKNAEINERNREKQAEKLTKELNHLQHAHATLEKELGVE
ncbi:hypothetical protein PFISCL1PPCAC_17791, partial [Pristionchus fissidentatus]